MNYHNAVKRILSTPHGSDPLSAERVSILCRKLGASFKGISLVTVSGSSGKSACSAMLSHALVSRGYRVGTLTTPFSHEMTECISVNCTPISLDDFAAQFTAVSQAVHSVDETLASLGTASSEEIDSLSEDQKAVLPFFNRSLSFTPLADELLIAMALSHFASQSCQILVIEVPEGERAGAYRLPLSATVNVITSTHTAEQASRICRQLDKRARETVTALQERSVYSVISNACVSMNCRLTMPLRSAFYPADFAANRMRFFYKEIERTLHSGAYYQALNVLTVSETLEALRRQGFSTDPAAVDFQGAEGNAGIPLQFSFLSIHPTVITDFSDTVHRVDAFAKSLSYHRSFLGEEITVLTCGEDITAVTDTAISESLEKHNIPLHRIIRPDLSSLRKTLKPFLQEMTAESTLLILGPRPFVYEATRAFRGIMN